MLNPYAFNFAIRGSERQSNAFEKSVRSAPNDALLSVADFNFSRVNSRQSKSVKTLHKSTLMFREKRTFKIF